MDLTAEVRPGANRYMAGAGVLLDLTDYLAEFETVAVITGEKSYDVFQSYMPEKLPYQVFRYDGSASDEDAARLATAIGHADAVVGIGGGRVMDTAKLTAEVLHSDLVLVPTIISNCAPYTPVTAVYNPDHSFKRIGGQIRASFLTIVDYQFLLQTPHDYFIAGIGDTVAKWYEIEGLTRHLSDDEKTAFIRLGIASAREILAILLASSDQAIADLTSQKLSAAFGNITDAIIGLSGTVGGFAGLYGRTAGAHAVHNGMTLLPETHPILHGAKVAYGVLVQLAYTNDFDEIRKLLPFYQKINLPIRLSQLAITNTDRGHLREMATFSASDFESFKLLDESITADKVMDAIEKLAKFVENQ
ncbi:iron-containing alcohol dehydrogenase family protein [Pseudolactococcus insecticola]|uniref:iron-containing alcohol dehydrogenase family protein n=1 Tax=Pseudolactococcus insecticola TaxID=2709158 RepID=UPI001554A5CF|nr:iron-containing alcohol dehydrogenase family protein [Lactococcus insecticola]